MNNVPSLSGLTDIFGGDITSAREHLECKSVQHIQEGCPGDSRVHLWVQNISSRVEN